MTRPRVLIALLLAGTACGRPRAEPEATVSGQGALPDQPVALAQATSGKPLIHVWKSPT